MCMIKHDQCYFKPYLYNFWVSSASPAHVGEVSNKGYEVALRWMIE
jgi:hypothetical protein